MKIFKRTFLLFSSLLIFSFSCKVNVSTTPNKTQPSSPSTPENTNDTPEESESNVGDDIKFTFINGIYYVETLNLQYVFDSILEINSDNKAIYSIHINDKKLNLIELAKALDYLGENDTAENILLNLDFTELTENLTLPTNLNEDDLPEGADLFIFSYITKEDEAIIRRSNINKLEFGNNDIIFENQSLLYLSECTEIIFGDGNFVINSAVINTPKLNSINFGNGSVILEAAAIQSDTLETISFGNGDYTLKTGCLAGCTNVKSIAFEGGDINISLATPLPELEHLSFGDANVISDYSPIFNGSTKLTSVDFGNGDYEISTASFTDTGITELNFGTGNKVFHNACFQSNSSLKSINFNDGDIVFGDGAFSSNPSLEKITFGRGKITIAPGTLYSCPNLSKVIFDNSVSWSITRGGVTTPIDLSDSETNLQNLKGPWFGAVLEAN